MRRWAVHEVRVHVIKRADVVQLHAHFLTGQELGSDVGVAGL